ncbi:MAG: exodeoxyribonuclease V subunit gamma [Rhodoferax sp.]
MVLHGNRLEDLRDLLIDVLRRSPAAPLEPEVLLVQSNGMKHWLEIGLAQGLGVCAATRVELPARFMWQMYRQVLGARSIPATLPLDKSRLVWRLLRLLPTLCAGNPVYAPLARYLGDGSDVRRLHQLSLQLADVLDAYQSYRADWLTDWSQGEDALRDAQGRLQALDAAQAWQPQLWRDVLHDLARNWQRHLPAAEVEGLLPDAPSPGTDWSRDRVHDRFVAALDALPPPKNIENDSAQRSLDLPRRVILFGISSLPMQSVQALAALGRHTQVLLMVLNPCRHYWGDLVEGHAALRQNVRRRHAAKSLALCSQPASRPMAAQRDLFAPDPTHTDGPNPGHPLLASWGKSGRDYLHLLDGYDQPERYRAAWDRIDVFIDPALDPQPSQLARLQSAILNLQPPPHAPVPECEDGSIVFVSAHSALREVEVLHNRLLALRDADPSVQPEDIMVMVPDMAEFSAPIAAVFGRFGPEDARHIPFSVADVPAQSAALVQALELVLALPESRLTLADWRATFEVPAVQRRFGLDDAGVRQIQEWLTAAGVRWGLDGAHRLAWGLPAEAAGLDQNTWDAGLRRLLLGYALGPLTPEGLWQGIAAQPALASLDAPLAAALLDWLAAVREARAVLGQAHSPANWAQHLGAVLERFFVPAEPGDDSLLGQLRHTLAEWVQVCAEAELDTALPLAVVREHWLAQLQPLGLGQRFLGGGVQFATLLPMRAIPFKVVALLGLSDGAYPRSAAPRDFDLMAQTWRAGDRSRREDDRYLFLEAVLSVRQTLILSWQGRRASDNSARAPSVLVAQLMDYLNACWSPPRTVHAQPLQAFSPRYFVDSADGLISYASDWWAALHPPAVAPVAPSSQATAPVRDAPEPSLEDLQCLLRQPVSVFYQRRLQVQLQAPQDDVTVDEPFVLDGLQHHLAGQTLLAAGSVAAVEPALVLLRARGELPLAGFGQRLGATLRDAAQAVLAQLQPWLDAYAHPLPAQPLQHLGGAPVAGVLACAPGADAPCLLIRSRIGGVLGADGPRGDKAYGLWVQQVALCAQGLKLSALLMGGDGAIYVPPLTPEAALAQLQRWRALWRRAWAAPLPVSPKAGWAFVQAQAKQRQHQAALAQWQAMPEDERSAKPPKAPADPLADAEKAFDSGCWRGACHGEYHFSPELQRAFADFAPLRQGLPAFAPDLYAALCEHAQPLQGAQVSVVRGLP